MKQINNQSEERSDFISDFKNQIARYTDTLSETSDEIRDKLKLIADKFSDHDFSN